MGAHETDTLPQRVLEPLLESTALYVRRDARKGRGLYARRALAEGTTVHEEIALCCSQYLDDVLQPTVPVCAHCLRSLESPRRVVARVTGSKELALQLPFAGLVAPRVPVPCCYATHAGTSCAEGQTGCTTVYCSVRCRTEAWRAYHAVSCPRHDHRRQCAWHAFLHYHWEQNGVDYGDTALLAFRAVAQVVCRHRQQHVPLDEAFAPFAQLARAPLTAFFFSYLLHRSAQEELTGREDKESMRTQYEEFLRSKDDPMRCPAVREQYDDGPGRRCKSDFLRESCDLVANALDLRAAERDFFGPARWSELLGSALLNGQERLPPSSYVALTEAVVGVPDGVAALHAYERRVLAELPHLASLETLSQSARGQGIYSVGCLFNHSCEPNVQLVFSGSDDETLTVVAMRPIAADEEVCISYIDEDAPFVVRQQQLYEHYLFECQCPRCLRDKVSAEQPR